MSYWFEGSGHDGDWVFTIGGYHPRFQRPSHYPKVDRLGISWRYDDYRSIGEEAYFAITPKVCMAGALIPARFQMDALRVWFDAHADFVVNYDPLQCRSYIAVATRPTGSGHDSEHFQDYEVRVDLGASYIMNH